MALSIPIKKLLTAGTGASLSTKSALTFLVDYNYPGAAVVPAGTKFIQQSDIDAFLAAHSTIHFKHLMDCWDALPDVIEHEVTINIDGEVQRPRNPAEPVYAFHFGGMKTVLANIYVNGLLPSNYRRDVAETAITGWGDEGGEYYVDFDGAPFEDLELRGYYVVFDTGQAEPITRHTDSRLYLLESMSLVPTTGFVGRPATILRNSEEDTMRISDIGVGVGINSPQVPTDWPACLQFQDIEIDDFDSYGGMKVYCGHVMGTRVLWDQTNLFNEHPSLTGNSATGFIGTGPAAGVYWQLCSARGSAICTTPRGGSGFAFEMNGSQNVIYAVVAAGSAGGVRTGRGSPTEFRSWCYLGSIVIDKSWGPSIWAGYGAVLEFAPWVPVCTIRNSNGVALLHDVEVSGTLQIGACNGTCLSITGHPRIENLLATNGPEGDNTRFGLDLAPPGSDRAWGAHVTLASNSNVSGTMGFIRMADGYIWDGQAGPIVDQYGNFVYVTPGE